MASGGASGGGGGGGGGGINVAALFATLGLTVNQAQWNKGAAAINQAIAGTKGVGTAANQAGGAVAGLGAKSRAAGNDAAQAFESAGFAVKAYLAYLGGHVAYDRLIKFNQQIQDSTIALAAVIEGNLGGSFDHAKKQANELYLAWQKFSTQTPVKTSEIFEFGKQIAAATFSVGGKTKDLEELAKMGVIAGKVLAGNRYAGYASLELSEMLMGIVTNRMVFAKQLLGFVHMNIEQFRELNEKQRLEVVRSALSSQAMKDAAHGFQTSFSGVTSTFEDKMEIAFGKVGKPLFDAITERVKHLNEWFERNEKTIEKLGERVGEFLVKAFEMLDAVMDLVLDRGAGLLGWIGEFIDGGELIKSFIIALGALLTAFAIKMAIAFATNPITLILMAVTALIYLVRQLMNYPGGVRQAFMDAGAAIVRAFDAMWDGLKIIGNAILGFFVDTIPDAIVEAFVAAFEAIADAPGVKQIIDVFKLAMQLGHMIGGGSGDDAIDSSITTPPLALPGDDERNIRAEPMEVNVEVGGISVSSPSADPEEVAAVVRETFHEELGDVLRNAYDRMA